MTRRIKRINELLKEEISQLLIKEIDLTDCDLVTVTKAEATANLQQAKIKITVMPTNKSKSVMETLQKNIFHLQQILNKKLNMRPVPKIIFEIDKGQIKAQKVEELLTKIKKNSET